MSSQMIEVVEENEIQFCRGDGASERAAMTAKNEESTEDKLYENPCSASTKSDNNTHAEDLCVEMGEQESREVNESIDAIERCASNGQSLYMLFCCYHYCFNMRIEGKYF